MVVDIAYNVSRSTAEAVAQSIVKQIASVQL